MSDLKNSLAAKILYFDCYSGVSGDMILGALLDCGLELSALKEILQKIDLRGYTLRAEKVTNYGIAGTRAVVEIEKSSQQARHLPEITRLIEESRLPLAVKERSALIFQRLAEAEASVHGTRPEQVHFHEVGAVDAIIDIVGAAAAMHLLRITEIFCSPLPLGRGEVKAAHGMLPLPAPATVELLKAESVPVYGRDTLFELVTPTGAAIVSTLAGQFGPMPAFNLEAAGYGAGSYDTGYPNYLRIFVGTVAANYPLFSEQTVVLETNIDDLNPEIFGYLMDKLFSSGALDVYFTPVQMKKNRPAVHLTVLAPPDKVSLLETIIFAETSTLGLRLSTVKKIMRPREIVTVQIPLGPVRVKVCLGTRASEEEGYAPEYEDCRAIAARSGLPLKEIYRQVEQAYRQIASHQ